MSRSYRVGLVVLGVLSLLDVAGPLLTDGENPPMSIALIGSALGVASLVCLALAWRGSRPALWALVVLRVLSALTAAPAFFVSDVPTAIRGLAGAIVLATLIGIGLVIGSRDRQAVVA